ncbi:MAG TPA: hypothetical protein VFT35_09655 [Gaiellaceae bacterium]|jgi:hypothetical protein|nr:hypothetical protein [Gaiellaceae bacterium]
MERVRRLLSEGGIAILAIVFALAFATFNVAVAIAQQVVSALVQNTVDDNGQALSFTVFGTTISYSEVLYYGIALVLVAGALYGAWLASRRTARICPECMSQVPQAATICRYCTSELTHVAADA